MYLSFGELYRIICSPVLWPSFKRYFPLRKDNLITKLKEIEFVRNAYAHFRAIQPEDVEEVKNIASRIFPGVEQMLWSATCKGIRLPLNTRIKWQQELLCLGERQSDCVIRQSPDGEWLSLITRIPLPVISLSLPDDPREDDTIDIIVANVSPAKLLNTYKPLRSAVIYVTENSIDDTFTWSDNRGTLNKYIRWVFTKSLLKKHYQEIASQIRSIWEDIARETLVLSQDSGAGTNILTLDQKRCLWDSGEEYANGETLDKLFLGNETLDCVRHPEDPEEYWGDIIFDKRPIFTKTLEYPWTTPLSFRDWSLRLEELPPK